MFLFDILEALVAYDYVHFRYFKQNEVVIKLKDANDTRKRNQLTGPGCLQRVLRGVNRLLFSLYFALLLYSQLSLSRIPRDSLKHFEISVPRHIRVERVSKIIN